ncbi:hypothetical protein PMIN04_005882 [Paraphaeosphaeria minitans]
MRISGGGVEQPDTCREARAASATPFLHRHELCCSHHSSVAKHPFPPQRINTMLLLVRDFSMCTDACTVLPRVDSARICSAIGGRSLRIAMRRESSTGRDGTVVHSLTELHRKSRKGTVNNSHPTSNSKPCVCGHQSWPLHCTSA